jgi:hypothetical protein
MACFYYLVWFSLQLFHYLDVRARSLWKTPASWLGANAPGQTGLDSHGSLLTAGYDGVIPG